jgi:hypothetical protein
MNATELKEGVPNMARMLRYRPSAGTMMIVALIFALSVGGATASTLITGRQIKDHSIGLVDLKKKTVTLLHGRRGPQGPQGLPGAQGPVGPPGPAGQSTILAYAHVSKGGTVIGADSKNIKQANMTRTAVGQYCFRGLSISIRSAIASPSAGKAIGAVVGPATTTCSFVVSTYAANGARVDNAFYVQFA